MSQNNQGLSDNNQDQHYTRNFTRRRILFGTATLISLAGCSGPSDDANQTPTQTTTEIQTPEVTDPDLRSFWANLSDEGITIESLSYSQDQSSVDLVYTSTNTASRDTVTNEIGTITGVFFNSLDSGLNVERLDATVLGPQGDAQITWYAKKEWYQDLQSGEISPSELTLRVVETSEKVE